MDELNKLITKCPTCQSENTGLTLAIKEAAKEDPKATAVIVPDLIKAIPLKMLNSPLVVAGKRVIPILIIVQDVCLDCGTIFARELVIKEQAIQNPGRMPPMGHSHGHN